MSYRYSSDSGEVFEPSDNTNFQYQSLEFRQINGKFVHYSSGALSSISSLYLKNNIDDWSTSHAVKGNFGGVEVNALNQNQKSTITINANVEPYLETSLDKTIVDFNVNNLTDSTNDINLAVKSNMNYKIESKFSGLKNTDSSIIIDNSQFKLSINSIDKPLIVDGYTILEDNQVFGETIYPINLTLKSSQVIKADTYSGSLEFKVSQL